MRATRALVLLLSLVSLASAASVGPSTLAPASASTGIATTVTVTSSITDEGVIASTVNLQRLDSSGRVLSVLGTLHDDGVDGDPTANDKSYSLRFSVFENSAGPLVFRVSAGFAGSLTRVFSAPMTLNVTGVGTGIQITSPANLQFLNSSPVIVAGAIGDPAAQVTINGLNATKAGTSFQLSLPLVEGNNTITAVAKNSNGSTNTASIQVTLDTTPPTVTILSPLTDSTTADATATVSGIVNDIVVGTVNDREAQVTVNGRPATVSNRTFTVTGVPLQLGANVIQALARDQVGNSATTSASVTRQAPPPQSLQKASGDNQSGVIGTALPQQLAVRLLNGVTPVANVPVVFKVTQNDGYLQPGAGKPASIVLNSDAQGFARASLVLGTRSGAGNNAVEVTATGFGGAALFIASGRPQPASKVNVDSGNSQTGTVNQTLALPFVAIVTDAGNNRVGGVPVTFTVKTGGGAIKGATTASATSDSNGRALALLTLGTQPGPDSNTVEASFPGNTGASATFSASSKVPGNAALTRITGVVLDNSNNPIPNVSLRLFLTNQGGLNNVPVQVGTPVLTNAQGYFNIQPAPVGFFKLMADGSTAAVGQKSYPTLEYDIVTIAGQENTLGMPVYLPVLDQLAKVCVNETTGGTLSSPKLPGFSLKIAPGGATFPGGARSGCVTVSGVNPDKVPMTPGFGQQPRFIVTIQPVGTVFSTPAAITIPNVDGLAPRSKTEMYSYDHDLASFIAIGSATVSDDGSVIASDPGVGVLKAGWHCGGNPNSAGGSASLAVTLTGGAAEEEVGKSVNMTAAGTPPLDGEYINWTIIDDPADPADDPTVAEFTSTPSCPGQASCVAPLKGKKPGIASVRVTFKCTTNGNSVQSAIVKVKFKVTGKIIELIYSGPDRTNVVSDEGAAFGSPQYKDANENGVNTDPGDNNFPVSYVRNTPVSLAGVIKFPQSITSAGVKVKGEGPNGMKWETTAAMSSDKLTFPATASTGNLPNTVKLFATFDVKWSVSFDNGTTFDDVGVTKNRAYVTLAKPIAPTLYESLLDIGTRNADSKNSVPDTVSSIWSDYQGPIPGVLRRDGAEMKYWNPRVFANVCQTLAGILKTDVAPTNANGSCLAWSALLQGTLQGQGITGAVILQIVPDTTVNPGATGFLVKNWKFDRHVTTGPNGRRNTDVVGDDVALFAKNNGFANTPCVGPAPARPIRAVPAGDDVLAGGVINSGADGICNTAAAAAVAGPPAIPADVQLLPVGSGQPNAPAIGPGPDGKLDSVAQGDDTLKDGVFAGMPFPYSNGFDAVNQDGIPGQGNPEPPEIFQNHFVIQYSGRVYDPSYGAGPFATQLAHETAASDGISGGGGTVKKKAAGRELVYAP